MPMPNRYAVAWLGCLTDTRGPIHRFIRYKTTREACAPASGQIHTRCHRGSGAGDNAFSAVCTPARPRPEAVSRPGKQ